MRATMAMSPVFEVGVVAFADTDSADRVVDGLRAMDATHLVNDISLIEHHENGRFSVHAYSQETTRGANIGAGAVIGTVVGALFLGPFGLVAGLIGGGAVGASLGGRNPHDLGLSDAFVSELRASLPRGSSAVLIAGEPDHVEELMGHVRKTDAVIVKELREPLSDEQAAAIRKAIEQHQAG
jgi:uncharacterized membrane protein